MRFPAACRTALRRRTPHDDAERGEATGWATLAGLATVSTVAMVARYHELLAATFAKVAEVPLDGLPGA
jgi:hypothetical protein